MYCKTFEVDKDVPLTVDFLSGVTISGREFKGEFRMYEIVYVADGVGWFDINRNSQIQLVGEDNCLPIGTLGFKRFSFKDVARERLFKNLGKFQLLPGGKGWLTIIIWLDDLEIKKTRKL